MAGSHYFALQAHEKMHIDCEMMKGNHVPFEMETTDTILDIKKRIHESEGIDMFQIVLYYNGKVLADDMTLETVKIQAGSNTVPL